VEVRFADVAFSLAVFARSEATWQSRLWCSGTNAWVAALRSQGHRGLLFPASLINSPIQFAGYQEDRIIMRRLKLFRMGAHQVIRIPRELEIEGDTVIIRKQGNRLVLEPVRHQSQSLLEFLATLEPIDEEFPEIDDPPPEPVDL